MHNRAMAGAALALLVWASVCAQTHEPVTRVERFLSRKGVLVVKESHFIGAVPGLEGTEVRVEALALSAPAERERVYGVRLVRPVTRKDADERTGIIDFDELAFLQEALDYMLRVTTEAKPPDESSVGGASYDTESAIITRGGVKAALIQTGRQFTGRLRVGGTDEDAEISFGTGALGRLRALLSQAREKLVALGAR